MDGTAAISSNLEALRRILAGLCAMAGFSRGDVGNAFPSDQEKSPCEGEDDSRRPDARRLPRNGEVFLPRHLRLAVLRLLRPAEAAARRLIVASARGLTVTLPPPRVRKPRPATAEPFLRRFGIAVVAPAASILPRSRGTTEGGGGGCLDANNPHSEALASGMPRRTALPLCDPPRRFRASPVRRSVPAHAAPRILWPGLVAPHAPPPPRSPDDPVDATRLGLRLAALAAALDDLPGEARRFARWQALRARRRVPRRSPLRPGRPPGGRLARFDPAAARAAGARRQDARRGIREVDEVLAHAHALALFALTRPDTS